MHSAEIRPLSAARYGDAGPRLRMPRRCWHERRGARYAGYAIALLALGALVALTGCYEVPLPQRPSSVSLFGDSMVTDSQNYLVGRIPVLHPHTYGGTALCDWLPRIRTALDQERPAAVVLVFSGNNSTPCVHGLTGQPLIDKYKADVDSVRTMLTNGHYGANLVLIRVPVNRGEANKAFINGWSVAPSAYVYDAGSAVAPNQRYVDTLNGVQVRMPDGVHLTAAGAKIFAAAIAGKLGW